MGLVERCDQEERPAVAVLFDEPDGAVGDARAPAVGLGDALALAPLLEAFLADVRSHLEGLFGL